MEFNVRSKADQSRHSLKPAAWAISYWLMHFIFIYTIAIMIAVTLKVSSLRYVPLIEISEIKGVPHSPNVDILSKHSLVYIRYHNASNQMTFHRIAS